MKKTALTIIAMLGLMISLVAQATMTIPVLNDRIPGPGLEVPVNVNFSPGVASFTVDIQFNTKVMSFTGIADAAFSGIQSSVVSGNKIRLYYLGASSTLNGKLLDLVFNYHGGDAPLTFTSAQLSNSTGGNILVSLTNGAVYMIDLAPGVNAGVVQANAGTGVMVPVSVDAFYDIAGFWLKMKFSSSAVIDGSVAVVNVHPNLGGTFVSNFTAQKEVIVSWVSNAGGTNISLANGSKLFDLSFTFDGGTSAITFDPACEMNQNIPAESYPPFPVVNYSAGSVADLVYNLGGVLKYGNATGTVRPITNSVVYLKTADGQTTLGTTLSDAVSGEFLFSDVVAGNYIVTASTDKPWAGVNLTDAFLVFGNPSPTGFGDALINSSADNNNSNVIDQTDAFLIVARINGNISSFGRGNWVFESLSISVIDEHVTQDVRGVVVGDVNTTWPN